MIIVLLIVVLGVFVWRLNMLEGVVEIARLIISAMEILLQEMTMSALHVKTLKNDKNKIKF